MGRAQGQCLPLERSERQIDSAGQEAVRAPDAAGDDHELGAACAGGGDQSRHTPARDVDRRDRAVLEQQPAAGAQRPDERRNETSRIDLMIARTPDARRDRGAQSRLEVADLAPAQPAGVEAGTPLMVVPKTQPLDFVATERDDERALGAIVDRELRLGFDRGAIAGPQLLALDGQRQQILAARFMFRGGGQHAGSGEARARAGLAAVEHRHGEAASGEPPGNRQADDAGTDDGDIDAGR